MYPALEEANRVLQEYMSDLEGVEAEEIVAAEEAAEEADVEEDLLAQLAKADSLSETLLPELRKTPFQHFKSECI